MVKGDMFMGKERSSMTKYPAVLLICGVLAACSLFAFGLTGCSSSRGESSVSTEGETAFPIPGQEQVKGTVIAVGDGEVLMETKEDAASVLQGQVRIGISAIDSTTVAKLKTGSVIVVYYTGMVGMSFPPFVPATEIQIVV